MPRSAPRYRPQPPSLLLGRVTGPRRSPGFGPAGTRLRVPSCRAALRNPGIYPGVSPAPALPASALRNLLLRVDERLAHHHGLGATMGRLDLELRAHGRLLDRHHGEADVLIQARRVAGRGHVADLLALTPGVDGIHVDHRAVDVGAEPRPADLDADQLALDPLRLDALEGRLADEVGFLVEVDHPLVAHVDLEGIGVEPHVAAKGQDTALYAANVARPDDGQAVRLAGLHDRIPDLGAVAGSIGGVDLVAQLRGVTRARDHHRHAVELLARHVVIGDVEDALAEQVDHHLLGLRPLYLHGGHVRFADGHVQAGVDGHALGPEQHVAVGQREPEVILLQAQQDRVVEDTPLFRGDEDVLALPDLTLVQVARDQHVGESEGVGAGDLDLPLHGHVPQRHAIEQLPILLDGVEVDAGVIHVVVHAVQQRLGVTRGVIVRRLANPRVLQDARGGVDGFEGRGCLSHDETSLKHCVWSSTERMRDG